MADRPTIWLTRPRDDSASFSTELAAQGLSSIVAPVLHIVHQSMPPLPGYHPAALLITSRHAAQALPQIPATWRNLPAYCVGNATAQRGTEHGLTRVIPGARNALALLPHIVSDLPPGSNLLYLAGDETRSDVVTMLGTQNIHVTTAVVYHAVAERTLNDQITNALADQKVDAVAFFSARSAEIACKLMKQHGLTHAAPRMHAYCLSANVAQAARALPWAAIHTCNTPTRHAMRELIVSRERKKG